MQVRSKPERLTGKLSIIAFLKYSGIVLLMDGGNEISHAYQSGFAHHLGMIICIVGCCCALNTVHKYESYKKVFNDLKREVEKVDEV